MKRWMKILLTLMGTGTVAALLVYVFVYNKPHEDYEKKDADFKLSAEVFFNECKSNQEASKVKYNDKVVQVSGKLSKIEDADTLVTMVYVFEEGMFGDAGVRCEMLEKYNEQARNTPLGEEVSLKGFYTGFIEDANLKYCSIVVNE
jgi:hypothetical protein